jgi:arylsulfatase A
MYFGDMVSYMDKIVGRIIAKLDKLGLTDNTLVLFTGDNGTDSPIISMMNGIEVKGEKGKTTNGGTHVPLIAYWPGIIKPGQVSDELVDFSDFLPTICEAAGITVPASLNIDGKSFLHHLWGSNEKRRDWIYCWYSANGDKEKARVFARNQRYKLYHNGEFYDISKDTMEKKPLQESELDDNTRLVKEKLQIVIDTYQGKTK